MSLSSKYQQVKTSDAFTILGLDVGDARIGVARAHSIAKLSEPLVIIENNSQAIAVVAELIKQHEAGLVIVGIPLAPKSNETEQTKKSLLFAKNLKEFTNVPLVLVDESYTSTMANESPRKKGLTLKSNDADAACYILDRYFLEGDVSYV